MRGAKTSQQAGKRCWIESGVGFSKLGMERDVGRGPLVQQGKGALAQFQAAPIDPISHCFAFSCPTHLCTGWLATLSRRSSVDLLQGVKVRFWAQQPVLPGRRGPDREWILLGCGWVTLTIAAIV